MTTSELNKMTAHLNYCLVMRALHDPAFHAQLLKDPRGTIEKATGITLPSHVSLKVVEATQHEYTVVLPYAPGGAADGELSDSDLEAVAGGAKESSMPVQTGWQDPGFILDPKFKLPPIGIGVADHANPGHFPIG